MGMQGQDGGIGIENRWIGMLIKNRIIYIYMIQNRYRRKPDAIEMDKQNYERHIARLQSLKTNWSSNFKKIIKDQIKLKDTISRFHQTHERSRKHELTERNLTKRTIKRLNYNRIKSVVKNDFNRQTLPVPPKHAKHYEEIDEQNEKIYERILQIKSNLNTDKKQSVQKPKKISHIQPQNQNGNDFSKIFTTSKLNQQPMRELKLKLGKYKTNLKIRLRLDQQELLRMMRDRNELYQMEVGCGVVRVRSELMVLDELIQCIYCINTNKKVINSDVTLTFVRVLEDKELVRGSITIKHEQLSQEGEKECKRQFLSERKKRIGQLGMTVEVRQKNERKVLNDQIQK